MTYYLLRGMALLSLLFAGAIFGFFYAWVCSTMWGLDQANPNIAIAAMQAMNASVRNGVFAPAFFGTPIVLLLTAGIGVWANARVSAVGFGLAGLVYLNGALILTMLVNVPMNEALALIELPSIDAKQIWSDYSGPWQTWNLVRTIASGCAVLLTGFAIMMLPRRDI